MAAVNADVWVLTEGHAEVSPGEAYRLISQSECAGNGTLGERWIGIWSRLPANAVMTVDRDRTAAIEIDIAPNRSMVVFGTVLP